MKRLRVSSLPSLAKCPGFVTLRGLSPRSSSKAADTGSAVGRAVELLHRGADMVTCCAQVAAEALAKFPAADLQSVGNVAERYWADPRNQPGGEHGDVVPELQEGTVNFTLPAHPLDTTGDGVPLRGHIDQVRRGRDGILRLFDVKNGKPEGRDMLHSYSWQLAGYCLAATEEWGETVLPGGIIRTQGYLTKNRKRQEKEPGEHRVFFLAPWSLSQCSRMLETASLDVALLRRGIIPIRPGTHCNYCPASGPHSCQDEIRAATERKIREA